MKYLEIPIIANTRTVTKYQGFDVMTIEQAEEFIKDNSKKHFGKAGE